MSKDLSGVLAREVELTSQYQPIIAKDCFDKFFDETKKLEEGELGRKNNLIKLFKRVLSYQTTNPEALAAVPTIDEIKSQEDLNRVFSHIDLENLKLIDKLWLGGKNNINPSLNLEFSGGELSASTKENLQSYIDDTGFSGGLVLSQHGAKYEAHSENIAADTSFATHSVGKIFTGVLVIEALRQEPLRPAILQEEQLNQPVKLEESVLEKLPEEVREKLKTATLHQLMTHKSGLQDYLDNYQDAIKEALNSGQEVPKIEKPEDLLQFAESEIKTIPYVNKRGEVVESDYSNLGSLLVGLAVQNAYNEKHPDDKLTYDQILRNYVLVPAGVNNFSATKPENGCSNSKDLVAPHIAGSPAGGYWTDTESLNNFGSWLCDKWKDPEFKRLTKEYGQEFYYPKSEMLGHGGSIESSCSYLMAFVDKGIVYAGLSNQPINTHVIAADLEKQVMSHYEKLAKPLVIYVAEIEHGDMAYSSLVEQIAKDCESKGLKNQIFSEFSSQSEKLRTQKDLTNVPTDLRTHAQTTEFLDEKFIEMGSLKNRFDVMLPNSWESYPETLTPSQLFENCKENVDHPEILKFMEDEIEARKKYEEEFKASGKDESLREKGKGNSSGKEEGGDLYEFNRLRTGLHFRQIHEEMAGDVIKGLKEDADVVIMIAGGPHIPGLASQLETRFENCEKLVVGNFPDNDKDATFADIGRESCAKIGKLAGFEINEDTKKAYIPEFIEESVDRKAKAKMELKGDVLSALDLAVTDRQIEGLREDKDQVIKSFAEKIRPSKNKSGEKSMAGDLIRSSSFVDRVVSEKSDSSESKER